MAARTAGLLCLLLLGCAATVMASTCSTLGGVCGSVTACKNSGRHPISGICPGSASIQCCFVGEGKSCAAPSGSGICKVKGYQTCSGVFISGQCDGPAVVKCCIPGSAPPPPPAGKGCTYWATEVAIPSKKNTGLDNLSQTTLTKFFGRACSSPSVSCTNKGLSATLKKNLVSSSGYPNIPFTVTMVKPAIQALNRIFTKIKAANPDLHSVIKDSGALCCRGIKRIDGTVSSTLSLHSWGVAVDLRVCTKAAARGANGKTYRGIVAIAPYFQAEGFYWGAAFTDAMHFEVSSSLFAKWVKSGALVK